MIVCQQHARSTHPYRQLCRNSEPLFLRRRETYEQRFGPRDVELVADFHVFSALMSCTRELYFQLFGPTKVIEGTFMSIAVMVAVIVRCVAAVAPGEVPGVFVSAASGGVHVLLAGFFHAEDDVVVVRRRQRVANLDGV